MLYEKQTESEPLQVLYLDASLPIALSSNHEVKIIGVQSLKMRSDSSQPSFTGLLVTDEDQLLYFKYSFAEDAITLFSFESKIDSHSCFQYSSELYSSSTSNAVDFVAYFECSSALDYYLTIFDHTQQASVDTVYFRGLENGSSSSVEKWYLSAAESLTADSLSWVGHGILGETRFLYL